ncbi:MAG: hypothetical protein IKB34_00850 [Clostridia bacterium]|nr:hypothetical protein [Clostridia bacterium]
MPYLLIKDIRLPISEGAEQAIHCAAKKLRAALGQAEVTSYEIHKKSIDARRRGNITVVWSVTAELACDPDIEVLREAGISILSDSKLNIQRGTEPLSARPVVCGFGPAGMFAALLLAENGYRPLVIERGDDTEDRIKAVESFYRTGRLDPESNIQFGAGGAGTFSDGKLVTRISDPRCRYVLKRFYEFGAPKEVLTQAKPHVGTDILRKVVNRLRDRIRELGGEILFRCALNGYGTDSWGRIKTLHTTRGDIPCGALILATGHSARDIYSYLLSTDCEINEKPFSVGVRIEHLREDIDAAMYGSAALAKKLGHAEYACSYRRGDRGVYTFCMCPGGEVVAAASEEGGVVVNGMSRHARDGRNSNSAVAVSVTPDDCRAYGGTMSFQRHLERAAFKMGGSDYSAPIQTVGDFLSGKRGTEPSGVFPTYMENGKNTRLADLSKLFPEYITEMLRCGIRRFNSEVRGFSSDGAILTGAETRTSAPYRIVRNQNGTAPGYPNLYPTGEGAGYAGGITSAAVDGIEQASAIISLYAPTPEKAD